ncbi:prostaglandin E receptor 1c (subtype EP1) [Sardina pilchardus]|uniref:prostaglandin E receptor 1c (subtype EP1) n=1 Tax=Sardina pilchardus TaxID=27697 RepID=UPI002E10EB6B
MALNDCSTSPLDIFSSLEHPVSLSVARNRSLNATSSPAGHLHPPPAYAMSCLSMSLGVASNLVGLAVLAGSSARFRRRAKAPFVLLARALLLTDLAGQLITGAFALYLHLEQRHGPGGRAPGGGTRTFCGMFGACMVFFGLCPLLLGSAMAAERCGGITRPLLHVALATVAHARLAALVLMALALGLAALPLLGVGGYARQYPGTWCFLPVHGQLSPAHAALALVFAGLGLGALLLSVLCNTASGAALLLARRTSRRTAGQSVAVAIAAGAKHRGPANASSAGMRSLDVEMMTQLAVINVVSCVCWCPFLICISLSVGKFLVGSLPTYPVRKHEQQLLLCLRLASWNQILDPWVYILLRRAVLRRVCCLLQPDRISLPQSSSSTGYHR